MCEANRIDHDESKLNEEELAEWRDIRGKLVQDICRGQLVIDAEGRPIYTPEGGKPFTFNPATGATFMALETYGKGKDVSNSVAAMQELTGTNKGDFSRLPARDFHACQRIARLFLADR